MTENQFKIKTEPSDELKIQQRLGINYQNLEAIRSIVQQETGDTEEEWKYYGPKNGWILKKYYKKRNLFFIAIYDGFFNITFVFGDNAVDQVLVSHVSDKLKNELAIARKYAEGRALSIQVSDSSNLSDIKELIRIKIKK
jgi:hypothetical protein